MEQILFAVYQIPFPASSPTQMAPLLGRVTGLEWNHSMSTPTSHHMLAQASLLLAGRWRICYSRAGGGGAERPEDSWSLVLENRLEKYLFKYYYGMLLT